MRAYLPVGRSDRQCKGIALGGAGENRAGPKHNDLSDFSGGGLRRAVLTGSGSCAWPCGSDQVRADSIGFDLAYSMIFPSI